MPAFASFPRSISTCILAAASLAAGPAFAVQIDVAFDAGGDMASWNQAPNWDPDVVPNNGPDTYAVSVDQNGAYDVQLDVNATIDSLSVGNDDTLTFGNGFDLTIVDGGLDNENLINLDSTGSLTILTLQNGAAITGGGTIDLSDNAGNRIRSDGTTITQGASHTIEGAGRLLGNTGGMINDGTILANETTTLLIDPDALGFTNQGTMQATGAGGFVFTSGVFTNTGQTIEIQDGSKLDLLVGTTVSGGTLQTTGTGTVNLIGVGETLNDITLEATVVQGNNADTNITGSFTNNGTWSMNSTGALTEIAFDDTAINGTGTIDMNNQANNIIRAAGSTVLTHGANHTIEGAGRLLFNTGGMINNGTILANESTAMLVDPNALGFTNQGTMQATGAGGFVFSNGMFTNTGQTIDVQDGSKLDVVGASVSGGTLQTTGTGAVNLIGGGTTFDDITLEATVAQGNNADTDVTGSFTNNGTWSVNGTGAITDITFDGTAINGTGTIDLGNQSNHRIVATGSTLLTHGANHTIEGAGELLGNSGGMINNGTILANETTAMLINPSALGFDNQGTLRAAGSGGIDIVETLGDFTTSGIVDVEAGSRLDVLSGGVYEQTGGTTTVHGTLAAGLRVDIEGGRLQGGGVVEGDVFNLTGGIVGPGTSPDTLILTDEYTQDAQSRFEVEIFGFLQGSEFDFLDVGGEAFLDGFVDVIVDPAFGQTLVIGDSFVILEADGGVNDMFASLNVNLVGLEFEQIVNPFDVTLRVTRPVPEPGTLVLLAAGLGALALARRGV